MPVMPLRGKYQRPDLRNHRKILVVDGLVGYTGSQNLIEPGYSGVRPTGWGRQWVDLMARITGPTVASRTSSFATDWFSETGQPQGNYGPHRRGTPRTTAPSPR